MLEVRQISLAAPAYNEQDGITEIVNEWVSFLRTQKWLDSFEIVICNDGSTDNTWQILTDLAKEIPEFKPITLEKNQGAAVALTTAIAHTTMPWVLLIDSDGQFPIEEVVKLAEGIKADQATVAAGVRHKKLDSGFARFGSWSSGVVANMFHGSHLKDFNCALKVVEGKLLRSLNLEAKGLNYSTEMTSKLLEKRAKIVEVNVEHRSRVKGKSSLKVVKGATHRLLFVLYIGMRQFLIRVKVLQIANI